MSSQYEPPPPDWDNLEPPDYDYEADFDPFPPPDYDWLPDDYVPDDTEILPHVPPLEQDGLQGFEPPEPADEQWSWQDARLIGVDRGEEAAENRYEIGVMDVYANAETGDLGGSYLPIASFAEEDPAVGFYHDLQREIHEEGLAPYEVADFAEARALEMQPNPPNWRGAEPEEYETYEYLRDLETFKPEVADEPPPEVLDPLIQTAMELGGVPREMEDDPSVFQALNAIGVQAEDFDPQSDPPPFYDAETGTAYWIGVFQADLQDRENCVTSILSLGRDPETGEMEANLAPCVPGDWDKTYGAAEYLIGLAQRGGIEHVFDAAEGMALATDQREFWASDKGIPLQPEAAQEIADFTREEWEVEL